MIVAHRPFIIWLSVTKPVIFLLFSLFFVLNVKHIEKSKGTKLSFLSLPPSNSNPQKKGLLTICYVHFLTVSRLYKPCVRACVCVCVCVCACARMCLQKWNHWILVHIGHLFNMLLITLGPRVMGLFSFVIWLVSTVYVLFLGLLTPRRNIKRMG